MAKITKEFRIYRANKTNNGVASAWQLSYKPDNKYDKWIPFLSVARQTGTDANGNAQFDWDGAIRLKLGEVDIGEILAVLTGCQQKAGYSGSIFHQTADGGNKVLNFESVEKGFSLRVSAQKADKTRVGPHMQTLSFGEGMILKTLLERAVTTIYGW